MYKHKPIISYTVKIIVLIIYFFFSVQISADILLANDFNKKDISKELNLFSPSEPMPINKITAVRLFGSPELFKASQNDSLLLGNSLNGYWIKGRIDGSHLNNNSVILRLTYNHLGDSTLFVKQQNGELIEKKRFYSEQNTETIIDHKLAFLIDISSPKTEFLLHVKPQGVSYNVYNVHAYLHTVASYDSEKLTELLFYGLLFGFLIAMFAYNFILYLYVGYRPYLYYCAYLVAVFFAIISASGLGYILFFKFSITSMVNMLALAPTSAAICLLQFGRQILELKYSYPMINRYYIFSQIILLLLSPLTLTSWTEFNEWLLIFELILVSSMSVVAWRIHKKKKLMGAFIFSLSFVVICLGLFIHVGLEIADVESLFESPMYRNIYRWMEHYVFNLFIMLEMILLSFALSSFIRQAELDKKSAQT